MPAARNFDMSPVGDVTDCNFMSIPANLWHSADPVQAGTSVVAGYNSDSPFCYTDNDRLGCDKADCFTYDFSKHCIAYPELSSIYCKPVSLYKGNASISSEPAENPVDLTSNGDDRNGKFFASTEDRASGYLQPHFSAQSTFAASHKGHKVDGDELQCGISTSDLKASIENLSFDVINSLSDTKEDNDYASDYTEEFDDGGLVIDTKDMDQEDSTDCDSVKNKLIAADDESVIAMESSSCHTCVKSDMGVTEIRNICVEMKTGNSVNSVDGDQSNFELKLESDVTETRHVAQDMLLKGEETSTVESSVVVDSHHANNTDSSTVIKTEIKDLKIECQLKAAKKKNLARQRATHENFISNRMLSEWPSVAKCRVGAGLQNLGNTCFVNATIQCLTYTLPLVNYLFTCRDSLTCSATEMCLMCEMERHMKECFDNGGSIVKPHSILQKLKVIARHMRWGRQEDAHEFLRYMVEAMHKSCINGHQPLPENTKDVSVVNEIFGGILRSQVTCLKCQAKSNTYDPFLDISLDVKNVSTILRALERYVEPETLDTDNAYNCTKCHGKVRAQKRFTIHRLPHVLTIQLKRYGITGGKVTRHITFPEVLDVRPFVSACRGDNDNSSKDGDEKVSNEYKYRLYGVLVHEGHSTSSGHYYCYVSTASGGWYCMNDHMVRRSSLNQVLNAEAYLLFYKRGLVSTSSSRANLCDNFSEDMLIRRNGPVRVCRSRISAADDAAQSLLSNDADRLVSVMSAEDCQQSSSPSRKAACLGGQQICEVKQGKRLLPSRLSCRGGQMNSSLKSVGITSRQVRKPQPLNVKSRKDIARYRHAVRMSCRDHKKTLNYPSESNKKYNENSEALCAGLLNAEKSALLIDDQNNKSEGNSYPEETSSICVPQGETLNENESKKSRAHKDTINGKIEGKESIPPISVSRCDESCAPVASGMPRIVLKIRQGRVVDSTVPVRNSVTDSSSNCEQSGDQILHKKVVLEENHSLTTVTLNLEHTKSTVSSPFDGPTVSKCNTNLSSCTAIEQKSLTTNVSSGSYDKLSQDYFAKLSQMCADVQSSSSARLSANHQLKPASNKSKGTSSCLFGRGHGIQTANKQKSSKSATFESLSRKLSSSTQQCKSQYSSVLLDGNSENVVSKKSILSRALVGSSQPLRPLNSSTANMRSLLNKPTGSDSLSVLKVNDDKQVQQQRGDVYDFDMGDEVDHECCSVTLALHRQNSLTNSDVAPTATVDVPGAYGSLVKAKRLFSHRSHTVINMSDEHAQNQNDIRQSSCAKTVVRSGAKDNLCKVRKPSTAAYNTHQRISKAAVSHDEQHDKLPDILGSGSIPSDISKKPFKTSLSSFIPVSTQKPEYLVSEISGTTKAPVHRLVSGTKRKLRELDHDKASQGSHKKVKTPLNAYDIAPLHIDCSEQNMHSSLVSLSPAGQVGSRKNQVKSSVSQESYAALGVSSDNSQTRSRLARSPSIQSMRVLKHLSPKSVNSSVAAPLYSQQSESLATKEPELVAAKIGPLRLKICRVPDANPLAKIYNVVVPEETMSSKSASRITSGGDIVKQHSAGQRAPFAETSGPGRGTLTRD